MRTELDLFHFVCSFFFLSSIYFDRSLGVYGKRTTMMSLRAIHNVRVKDLAAWMVHLCKYKGTRTIVQIIQFVWAWQRIKTASQCRWSASRKINTTQTLCPHQTEPFNKCTHADILLPDIHRSRAFTRAQTHAHRYRQFHDLSPLNFYLLTIAGNEVNFHFILTDININRPTTNHCAY